MATGIWQGRFQYVHNGHYYIFKNELPKFEDKMVAIVNPNPSNPAYSKFARFNDNRNPFTYFQRMMLWKKIADSEEMQVMIVPCWHARYKIALENDFLPAQSNRYWIIPIAQDDSEEDKAEDLRKKGEKIHSADFESENDEYARISASMVRQNINRNNDIYKQYIPECIWKLTEDLCKEIDNNKYFVVPFIDDKIDLLSIQCAINSLNKSEKEGYILFTITVHVSDGEMEWKDEKSLPWWFKSARHPNGGKTYYKRAKLIMNLMKKLCISKYLITPIFVFNEDIDIMARYNSAFLPATENMKVVLNEKLFERNYYKYNYVAWLDNINAEDNIIHPLSDTHLDERIVQFFSEKNRQYVMRLSERRYDVISDVLKEEIKEEIKKVVDCFIERARKDLTNGGLEVDQRNRLTNLIDNEYPELRRKYITQIQFLCQDSNKCRSEQELKELQNKIIALKEQLQAELESIEEQRI